MSVSAGAFMQVLCLYQGECYFSRKTKLDCDLDCYHLSFLVSGYTLIWVLLPS